MKWIKNHLNKPRELSSQEILMIRIQTAFAMPMIILFFVCSIVLLALLIMMIAQL